MLLPFEERSRGFQGVLGMFQDSPGCSRRTHRCSRGFHGNSRDVSEVFKSFQLCFRGLHGRSWEFSGGFGGVSVGFIGVPGGLRELQGAFHEVSESFKGVPLCGTTGVQWSSRGRKSVPGMLRRAVGVKGRFQRDSGHIRDVSKVC